MERVPIAISRERKEMPRYMCDAFIPLSAGLFCESTKCKDKEGKESR